LGINFRDIINRKDIEFSQLNGKHLAIDSFNIIYQFLATIRQRDGSLLTDSKGRVTSHLTGLFSRTTKLMGYGMKLVFVFDGEPPKLKFQERERRRAIKEEAQEKYEEAKDREDLDSMKKYAQRTSKLTPQMIEDAKQLLDALGIPIVQAPSEGEAQAAHMAQKGDLYATVSQDYDSLLFRTPRLIQNLTISQRRHLPGQVTSQNVSPKMITLEEVYADLGVTHEQLIALGILIGTDFNPGGVKGIGPKKAVQLVKKHGKDLAGLFSEVGLDGWKEIFEVFTNIPVDDKYSLEWNAPDKDKIRALLVDKHDFSEERVMSTIESISTTAAQKGLGEYF